VPTTARNDSARWVARSTRSCVHTPVVRWLSIGVLLALSSVGFAERMPARRPMPTIQSSCQRRASWELVTKCVRMFGVVKSIRSSDKLHLLEVSDPEGGELGYFLYVAVGTDWNLRGVHLGAEELLSFEPFTLDKHTGYRMEFGNSFATAVALEDSSTVPALMSTRVAAYCGGESYRCTEVTTACDILVEGKAYWTFRGTVEFPELNRLVREIAVVGDRTKAGQCAPAAHMVLDWSQG
jgi:hypothetical protein